MSLFSRATVALLAAVLTACGGGGGGGASPELRLPTASVVVTAKTTGVAPSSSIYFSYGRTSGREVHATAVATTTTGIARTEVAIDDSGNGRLQIFFKDPDRIGPNTYSDQVSLKLCYDTACAEHLPGSPRVVDTRYTVTGSAAPEPAPALPASAAPVDGGLLTATMLAMGDHNVVDAAYSTALEAIVMISTLPTPALYVYDTAADTEAKLALDQAPAALALGSDGRTVAILLAASETAVAKLVYAALSASGVPGTLTTASTTLVPASDLLLEDNRVAHLLPGSIGSLTQGFITSIDLETKAVQASNFDVPVQLTGALHPAGQAIYAIPPLPSTGDIVKFEVNERGTLRLYESGDGGVHPGCGRLWLSADGSRIYTACSAVFRASEYRKNDLTHMGNVMLFGPTGGIQSLSESVPAGEIAIAEISNESCYRAPFAECSSRLNFYDRDTVAAAGSFAIPDNGIAGFVFHDGSGDNLYIIARRYNDPLAPDLGPDNLLLKFNRGG